MNTAAAKDHEGAYDPSVLNTIIQRLQNDKIEFDADLYTGVREPWKFVDIETMIPDANVHFFMLRRFLKVCLQGVKIYLVCCWNFGACVHMLSVVWFQSDWKLFLLIRLN